MVIPLLRSSFSAGSSVSCCRGSCGLSSRQKAMKCHPLKNKRLRDLWHQPEDRTLRAGAKDSQTLCAQTVRGLCSRSLLGGTSWRDYFVIAPRLSYFNNWDIWDCAVEILVWLGECGGCSCGVASVPAQVVWVWLPEWLLDGWTGKFPKHHHLLGQFIPMPEPIATLQVFSTQNTASAKWF